MSADSRLEELEKRVALLEVKLSRRPTQATEAELIEANNKLFLLDFVEIAAKLKLSDQPQFFIGAIPLEPTYIPDLFESSSSPSTKLFEQPPTTRDDGFGLAGARERSSILAGTARELIFRSQGRRITQSARFTALFQGGDDFLGWAMRGGGWPISDQQLASPRRINSLVLIEATYESVRLATALIELAVPAPATVQYVVGFINMLWNGKGPLLLNGKADMHMRMRAQIPSEVGQCFRIITAPMQQKPEAVAFRLVAEIYHLFNLTDDQIPYARVEEGQRIVSPDQF